MPFTAFERLDIVVCGVATPRSAIAQGAVVGGTMAAARQALDSEFDRLLAQMAHSGGATGRVVLAELGPLSWQSAGAGAGAATNSVSVSPSASATASPSPSPSPRARARQRRARAAPRSADVSVSPAGAKADAVADAPAGRKRTPGGPAPGGNLTAASEGQQRRVRGRRVADLRALPVSSGSDNFITADVAAAHKRGAASVQSLHAHDAQESTAMPSRSTTPSTPREGSGSDDADWGDDVKNKCSK